MVEYEAARKEALQTRVPAVGKIIAQIGLRSINEITIEPIQYRIPVQNVPITAAMEGLMWE